jgi:hypothetical protein
LVIDQTHVTDAVLHWPYKGSGTEESPYVVEYIENDRRNPMLFPMWKKWIITILVAFVSGVLSCLDLIFRLLSRGTLATEAGEEA